MKLLILSLLLSLGSYAAVVDGTITYKLPDGNLVERDVTIDVPARGQGAVTLSGNGFEWKTTSFRSTEVLDRKIFTVAFNTEFRDMKAVIVLKGTYLQGKNYLLYSGDVYKAKTQKGKIKHIGVFNFRYDR